MENLIEDVGVANDKTGAGGTSGEDDNAVKQNQATQAGVDFDKLTSNFPGSNGKRDVSQESPVSSRGKSH